MSRFEKFYEASKRDAAKAKAFAESIRDCSLDEEDIQAIKLAFPKANFKCVGATFGAYDEEAHEELLREWESEQKRKIDEVRNSSHQEYLARVEHSNYFGWVKVDYYPTEGNEPQWGSDYSIVNKDGLIKLIESEIPYIDAGYELVNEYVLVSVGDVVDPSGFGYIEEAGFNI